MREKAEKPAKRKLTRAERKQIEAVIRQAKGDGKPHTAQQTIPYVQMYPDGICKVSEKKYSKSIVFEDINYQLAQADDKTAIFENWLTLPFRCSFLSSIKVQGKKKRRQLSKFHSRTMLLTLSAPSMRIC